MHKRGNLGFGVRLQHVQAFLLAGHVLLRRHQRLLQLLLIELEVFCPVHKQVLFLTTFIIGGKEQKERRTNKLLGLFVFGVD